MNLNNIRLLVKASLWDALFHPQQTVVILCATIDDVHFVASEIRLIITPRYSHHYIGFENESVIHIHTVHSLDMNLHGISADNIYWTLDRDPTSEKLELMAQVLQRRS